MAAINPSSAVFGYRDFQVKFSAGKSFRTGNADGDGVGPGYGSQFHRACMIGAWAVDGRTFLLKVRFTANATI